MTKILEDGSFVPFRVELDESSGPISPRFQYTITIAIWTEGGAVHVVREERVGSPRRKVHAEGVLSREAAETLARALEEHDALSRAADHVGDALDDKGHSCNRMVLTVKEQRAEMHYLLRTLERKDRRAEAAIVQAVKDAAATIPSSA